MSLIVVISVKFALEFRAGKKRRDKYLQTRLTTPSIQPSMKLMI